MKQADKFYFFLHFRKHLNFSGNGLRKNEIIIFSSLYFKIFTLPPAETSASAS